MLHVFPRCELDGQQTVQCRMITTATSRESFWVLLEVEAAYGRHSQVRTDICIGAVDYFFGIGVGGVSGPFYAVVEAFMAYRQAGSLSDLLFTKEG